MTAAPGSVSGPQRSGPGACALTRRSTDGRGLLGGAETAENGLNRKSRNLLNAGGRFTAAVVNGILCST
jgi:hypothetical protein